MIKETAIRIELSNGRTLRDSNWLEDLGSELNQELGVACTCETTDAPDETMVDGITVAVAIASLALGVINTLLIIIDHRKKESNRHSVTVTGENYSYTVSNLTEKEREKIIHDIKEKKLTDVIIKINE